MSTMAEEPTVVLAARRRAGRDRHRVLRHRYPPGCRAGGAGALAPSHPRRGVTGRVHPTRRGQRADRADRALGAPGGRPARAWQRRWAATAAGDRSQSLRPPAPTPRHRRRDGCGAGRRRPGPTQSGAGDHRDRGHGAAGRGHHDPDRAAAARRASGPGRLRHRLLIPELLQRFRSTSSRSTAPSSAASPAAPRTPPWPGRSSPSARPLAWRSSPSRRPSSWPPCVSLAAARPGLLLRQAPRPGSRGRSGRTRPPRRAYPHHTHPRSNVLTAMVGCLPLWQCGAKAAVRTVELGIGRWEATVTARRILLVDDEDHIREVAQVSLEMTAGWEVLTAGSGTEGLAKAAAEQPDAILLDMMMPDMDGPATFQGLLADQRTRHIPVVLLTAKVQAADRRRFAGLGVAGVIAKPFDPLGLADQVAETLGWGR